MIAEYRKFTRADLEETFSYEPETGKLYRRLGSGRIRECPTAYERGKRMAAAALIKFKGYKIAVTYIIFMLMEGRWPREGYGMDHRNHDPSDHRWENLREITKQQSSWNRPSFTGREKGVRPEGRKWKVELKEEGKLKWFGSYATIEEANEVSLREQKRIQGEFMHEAKPLLRRL